MKKFSFDPIRNDDSKILILGTMPGEKSLSSNQYYAHRGNQFWKIIFSLFAEDHVEDYDKRKSILIKNKIALWDVCMHCEREGSSDDKILNEVPNDFENFLKENNDIKTIFFNGNNAHALFVKHVVLSKTVELKILPSTSPANTWKSFEEKKKEWSIILEQL
jgi:hypoxanthine-DNA glycosylase